MSSFDPSLDGSVGHVLTHVSTFSSSEAGDDVENQGSLSVLEDPYGPYQVQSKVLMTIQNWGQQLGVVISPDIFLSRLLSSRGYCSDLFPGLQSIYRRSPTPKEIEDYDNELVCTIRNSDLPKLKSLHQEQNRSLTACNKFCESIVHMACRRAEFDIVDYLVEHMGEQFGVDDYGRTPLHDACWRSEPRFDIVTLLLDKNLDLLRVQDIRGANPLNYVRKEHWMQWCAYLFHQKEKYWRIFR